MALTQLTDAILTRILSCLDNISLVCMALTSHQFHNLVLLARQCKKLNHIIPIELAPMASNRRLSPFGIAHH